MSEEIKENPAQKQNKKQFEFDLKQEASDPHITYNNISPFYHVGNVMQNNMGGSDFRHTPL